MGIKVHLNFLRKKFAATTIMKRMRNPHQLISCIPKDSLCALTFIHCCSFLACLRLLFLLAKEGQN